MTTSMTQAFLITAYKNIHHLKSIIGNFDENDNFFIHIDKKSIVSKEEISELEKCTKNIFISRAYKTNWGGINHLNCTLLLLKEALKNNKIEYIHLISGHDYPIKSSNHFSEFLNKNKGKQFMEHFSLPAKVWENGGMDRLQYYNLYDFIDAKGKYQKIIHNFIKIQKKVGFKRRLNFGNTSLHGGSTWWTLNYACCNYVLNFLKENPNFLNKFKYTFCAEELFFQTIILNSPFKNDVVNDNLRYIDWEFRNGNIPAVLDESDFLKLIESKHLFARRFEYPTSISLINKLKIEVNKN